MGRELVGLENLGAALLRHLLARMQLTTWMIEEMDCLVFQNDLFRLFIFSMCSVSMAPCYSVNIMLQL